MELERQRLMLEEVDNKYKTTLSQLDLLAQKEKERQQEKRELDKRLALLHHDLKEAQRKVCPKQSNS